MIDPSRFDAPIVAIQQLEPRPPHLSVERVATELVDLVVSRQSAANQFQVAVESRLVADWNVVVEEVARDAVSLRSFRLQVSGARIARLFYSSRVGRPCRDIAGRAGCLQSIRADFIHGSTLCHMPVSHMCEG